MVEKAIDLEMCGYKTFSYNLCNRHVVTLIHYGPGTLTMNSVCLGLILHNQTKKMPTSPEELRASLEGHNAEFEALLRLIPAKYYLVPEDTAEQVLYLFRKLVC